MLCLRFLLALACAAPLLHATTVIPPTFDELVRDSELIFRGRVTVVRSVLRTNAARPFIATEVTFVVERALRGDVGETLTLEFLGGRLGDKELRLAGWPSFDVGDRGIFFVEDRTGRICPLMRLRHGRYRIVGDSASGSSATERVLRDDHSPLRNAQEVSRPMSEAAATTRAPLPGDALTLPAFEAQIVQRSAAFARPAGSTR